VGAVIVDRRDLLDIVSAHGRLAVPGCDDTAGDSPEPLSQYSYAWLTVDPVAAGVSVPVQPVLPSIGEPGSLPAVDAPVDEPLVPVIDRAIQLPAAY